MKDKLEKPVKTNRAGNLISDFRPDCFLFSSLILFGCPYFWLFFLLRRFSSLRHADGIVDGVDQAQFVAGAFSGKGEAGAMIHAGADDGKAQGDVDALHRLPGLLFPVIDESHGF